MIGIRSKGQFDEKKIRKKAETETFKNLGHAAATLRKIARRSIRRRKRPSPIGRPISTHTGAAKQAILYEVDRPHGPAIIGPVASRIGPAMRYHEHGGRRGKRRLPARPVMGPAMAKIGPRLSGYWAGSIRR